MKFDQKAHLSAYLEGAKDLRLWFVGYGIGAPLVFLSNSDVYEKISGSPCAGNIVLIFLFGVAFQILISILNKWINWILYRFYDDKKTKQSWFVRGSNWLSDQAWIDILADVFSALLFAFATMWALLIFVN